MKHSWSKTAHKQTCNQCGCTRETEAQDTMGAPFLKYRTVYYEKGKKLYFAPRCLHTKPMTKAQAILAMNQGERVTHPLLLPDQWVTILKDGHRHMMDESANVFDQNNFWRYKDSAAWSNNWKIV